MFLLYGGKTRGGQYKNYLRYMCVCLCVCMYVVCVLLYEWAIRGGQYKHYLRYIYVCVCVCLGVCMYVGTYASTNII